MDDLISREKAIEALKEHRNLFCDNTPDTFSVLPYGDKCRVDELDMAIATLINLPSAQPETHEERTETHECDCISRQVAIEALNKKKIYRPLDSDRWVISDCLNAIVNLPSAQPEIVRCKDCKYWREGTVYSYCDKLFGMGVLDVYDYMTDEDDYCSRAERKTDEKENI